MRSDAYNILGFLDWFIPDALRADPVELQRVRILLTSHCVGGVFGLVMLYSLYAIEGALTGSLAVVLALFAGFLANPFLIRLGAPYMVVGILTIIEFINLVFYVTYQLGGGWSFALYWALPIPMAAAFWTGRRAGIVTTVFVVTGVIVLYQLESAGFDFPEGLSAADALLMNMIGLVTATLFVAVLGNSYEGFYHRAQADLRVEIREHRRAREALARARERSEIMLASIGDGVITTDADCRVEFLNAAAERLTGWRREEAYGLSLKEVFPIKSELTGELVYDQADGCLASGRVAGFNSHHILVSRNEREIPVEHSASPVCDRDGKPIGSIIVFHDVTEARQLARQLSHQASHDPLTGLLNRREYERRVERVFESFQDCGGEHALCYLDLDQFKQVNDACGHVAGDQLLAQLGQLLGRKVRRRDSLARIGGDEFGLLLEHCPFDRAMKVAEELREAVAGFQFIWDERTFHVGVSIGVVLFDKRFAHMSELLDAADSAGYAAKHAGRNRVHVFRHDATETGMPVTGLQWATRVREALEQGRLLLYCQPIVPVSSQGAWGDHYEILLRMQGEDGELIPAGMFLPHADRHKLMPEIDRWVLRNTFHWLETHPHALSRLHICGINVSGKSLSEEDFPAFVTGLLDDSIIPPEKIRFEITEINATRNIEKVADFVSLLKRRGCRFALDDYAGGLPSLVFLRSLSVDTLKIDGKYAQDVEKDPLDQAMVNAIAGIGRAMGISLIAKSVESRSSLAKLREMGIDFAQGPGIARPVPLESLHSISRSTG